MAYAAYKGWWRTVFSAVLRVMVWLLVWPSVWVVMLLASFALATGLVIVRANLRRADDPPSARVGGPHAGHAY